MLYYCNNGLWDRPDIFFWPTPFSNFARFAPLNDIRAYIAWSWKTTLITLIFFTWMISNFKYKWPPEQSNTLTIAPFVDKLHGIKGMLVIFGPGFWHLAWERWIGPVNLFFVCCVSKKYDYINLHLNDNSTQINQCIVFKFSDHKGNIYPYPVLAKTLQFRHYIFNIFFYHTSIPNILMYGQLACVSKKAEKFQSSRQFHAWAIFICILNCDSMI